VIDIIIDAVVFILLSVITFGGARFIVKYISGHHKEPRMTAEMARDIANSHIRNLKNDEDKFVEFTSDQYIQKCMTVIEDRDRGIPQAWDATYLIQVPAETDLQQRVVAAVVSNLEDLGYSVSHSIYSDVDILSTLKSGKTNIDRYTDIASLKYTGKFPIGEMKLEWCQLSIDWGTISGYTEVQCTGKEIRYGSDLYGLPEEEIRRIIAEKQIDLLPPVVGFDINGDDGSTMRELEKKTRAFYNVTSVTSKEGTVINLRDA
jgi:hypothetical protein